MRTLENGVEVVRWERLKTDLDSVNTKRKKIIFVFERTAVLSPGIQALQEFRWNKVLLEIGVC
jgi:hypothetical protein